MKRLISTISILVTLNSFIVPSELPEAREKLYDAYITGNNNLWLSVMNNLEEDYNQSNNINVLYEVAKSQYGYTGMLIDKGEFEKAKSILSKAENNIEKLLDYNNNWTDVHSLKAGIYGFKIILYPSQVILNGPKGKLYLNKATSQKEITPSALVEMANYKYHTPALLGGDIDEAIEYYKYAIKLFELTNQNKNNWQYINTLVWLAISYDKKGESLEAKAILQKLLTEEPGFSWVRNNLYPKIVRNESISKTYYTMNE